MLYHNKPKCLLSCGITDTGKNNAHRHDSAAAAAAHGYNMTVHDVLDHMQGIFEGGTSLGDVYEGLANGGLHQAVAEFLADQTSDPSAWAFPAIQHAEGFEAYRVLICLPC